MDPRGDYFGRAADGRVVGGPRAPAPRRRTTTDELRNIPPRPSSPQPAAEDCICVTFAPEALERMADAIESRLLTSKGAAVRAPSTCMQPVSAADVDVFGVGLVVPAALNGRVVLATITAPRGRRCVVKGFAARLQVQAESSVDPFTQVQLSILINGRLHSHYRAMRFAPSLSLAGLTATTIEVKDGETCELVAERWLAGGASINASGRLKGWEYSGTANMDGVGGTVAY